MSATNRTADQRLPDDVYETPAWCVDRLLDRLPVLMRGHALEPCAGSGNIIRAVNAHNARYAMSKMPKSSLKWDIVEKRPDCKPALSKLGSYWIDDFFTWHPVVSPALTVYNVAITNPPFSLAMPFLEKCLPIADWVVFLLRINFLGSEDRADFWPSAMPDVYVIPNRPIFGANKKGKLGTDATEYAWFVWGPHSTTSNGRLEVLSSTPKEERQAYLDTLRKKLKLV